MPQIHTKTDSVRLRGCLPTRLFSCPHCSTLYMQEQQHGELACSGAVLADGASGRSNGFCCFSKGKDVAILSPAKADIFNHFGLLK